MKLQMLEAEFSNKLDRVKSKFDSHKQKIKDLKIKMDEFEYELMGAFGEEEARSVSKPASSSSSSLLKMEQVKQDDTAREIN